MNPAPAARRSLGHVPGLDGLRGVAVIGVLLFHANGWLRGGYLGVDLFFVLSGFLITSILVEEHRKRGRIDLRAFWVRRFRRLMPAMLSVIPAIALYARTLARPAELAALRADGLATLGYVANWRAIFARRSYWEMFAAPSPLEHTWSLSIEEQFYVIWPLAVAGILGVARGRVRALFATCVVLALASCVAMTVLFDDGNTMRVYLGTDTRGAAILVGAALATSGLQGTESVRARTLDLAGVVALAVLGVAWWGLEGRSELLYRGGFTITQIAAAVLILCCVRARDGLVARLFSIRPLRAMGTVSYGVYLWHWPIYVALTEERTQLGGARLFAVRVALTLAVAVLSYRFLERPIRERGLRFGKPLVIVPASLGVAVLLVIASTRAVIASPASAAETTAASASLTRPAMPPPVATADAKAPIPFGVIPPASELPPGTLRVLVLGDSVAWTLGMRMHYAQDSIHAYVDHRAVGDCSILDGVAPVFSMSGEPHGNGNCASSWVDDVKELRPDVTVVVIGGAYFSTVRADGRKRHVCHPAWHDAYSKRLSELLTSMAPFTGRSVVLGAAYPVGKWQTPTLNSDVDCYNRILKDATTQAKAELVDLNAFVCPDRKCTMTSRGAPVRPDGLHFDGLGAEDTAIWILSQLRPEDGGASTQAGELR